MEQFALWFIELFKEIVKNIWNFFKDFFTLIYERTIGDIIRYYEAFLVYSKSFSTLEWILAIISIVVLVVLSALIFVLIIQLIARYVRFVKTEKDKEVLLQEVSELNYEMLKLIDEKNAMLVLSDQVKDSSTASTTRKQSKGSNVQNRFTLLTSVDEAYQYKILDIKMRDEDKLSLEDLVDRFQSFSASQLKLYYSKKTIRIFFAGMATSKTMVLEGISGTGKTSLAYAMGKFFQNDAAIISVQPSWRDRSEMLGYLNEFTKRFNETDFLKALYETTYRKDINFIVLDEMNLARVEYYFADFLSILEMPDPNQWKISLITDQKPEDPIHFENGKLRIPENVWFVGTANKDDSTFMITDKVYDRVASIEMNDKATVFDAPYTEGVRMSYNYLKNLFVEALNEYQMTPKLIENLAKLDEFIIDKFQIAFGNRINKQIHTFVPVYMALGGSEIEALDYLVSRKILRKFESLNLPFLQDELQELIDLIDKLFGKTNFQDSKKMLNSYIRQF